RTYRRPKPWTAKISLSHPWRERKEKSERSHSSFFDIDRRKSEHEDAPPARPRLIHERPVLNRGEPARDRESESGASDIRRGVGVAVEGLKDAIGFDWRDARPTVGDGEHECVTVAMPTELHALPRRGVTEGVLQKISENAQRVREVESANQRGALEVDDGADRAAAEHTALLVALCRAGEV